MARPYRTLLLAAILGTAACGTDATTSSSSVTGPTPATTTTTGSTSPASSTAPACRVTFTGMPDVFPSDGGRYTLTVSAPAGCAWSARSESDAADVSTVSGVGNGAVTLTVQPHTSTTEGRSVTVTIGDTSQRVTQVAAACTASVAPTSLDVSKNGENREIALTIPAGCTWSATTNVDWIVNIAPASGTGAATIRFMVQPNEKGDPRTAEVVVAGIKVPVRQERNE